jgi:amino acid adenylation domain-containing protein/non-ribosomal peptide synthase protein (TIGR01720 family)
VAGSGLGLVMVPASLAARAAELTGRLTPPPPVLCWDPPGSGQGAAPQVRAAAAAGPGRGRELAYVFYTSGSTGVPKGAMVDRAGMLNHLAAKIDLLGLGPASVVVQNASHGFDISVWQMLAPLMVGGRVWIVPAATAEDPGALLACVQDAAATVLETVPTLLAALLDSADEGTRLDALRYLISNAETLPVALCRRWLERFAQVPLINTYGATECADDVTHQLWRTPPSATAARVGVGRPIRGLRIYVVDRQLRPLPLGCQGQVAIAGVGVGCGYLADPARTAAVFVPDPFAAEGGERLYLSGDLGRWTASGDLEHLGRLDGQLKVRGHRVEPGEVEAALGRHPAVRQVAVVARPDGQGGHRLIAYLVTAGKPTAAELQGFLAQTLPRPMIPERFVELAALPLTRNGKVDRQALPEPGPVAETEGQVPPRTALEAAIAGIWQRVLGLEQVGVHDDFFALGGHSLTTIQVRSRIKHQLGAELPLRSLFDHPTLAELAVEVGRILDAGGARMPQGAIPRLPDAAYYELSHAQRRLWFVQRMEPTDISYNMPELNLLAGGLRAGVLRRAFHELVVRHAILRTSFAAIDGEPAQRIAPQPASGLSIIDLSALPGHARDAAVRALVAVDARTPFDLATPPVRARLLMLAADRHLLHLTLHHIVTDAWSWQRLGHDLLALYTAFAAGRDNPLPPLPIRYVDFAAWQNGRVRRGEFAGDERYWLGRLKGTLPVLELPADHAPPAVRSLRGAQADLRMGSELAARLRRFGIEHDLTLFMTLLAAASAFLSRTSGQTDLILGTPSAGRDHLDTEGVIGCFVNMLALRVDLGGDPSFLDLVERSRQISLDAYAHHEYPFDLLVQKLNPVRELGRSALFSSTFAVEEAVAAPWTGDLAVQRQAIQPVQAMPFDLSVVFSVVAANLTCWLIYSLDLFVPATIERWLRRLQILLDGAIAHPRLRLSELPLWTPEERVELTLRRRPATAAYPLSFPQRDIWFQCQLYPGTPCYNCCLEAELHGPLHLAGLRCALGQVVARHEGLRASFAAVDGRAVQRVTEAAAECAELDLSARAREDQEKALDRFRAEVTSAPFDLETGPLYRFALARLGSDHCRLLLVIHHLVIDAVNLLRFLEQVLDAYAGDRRGDAATPAALPLHYPDFAAWQDARLRMGALARNREHWRGRLRGGLPGLQLHTDRPRPARRSFAATELSRRIPAPRLAALKRVRTALGSSLFRTVLAIVELLLSRLTGDEDVTVAVPVSIRPGELAQVPGYFANALPLRLDLRGDPSFRELLERVDEAVAAAVRHGDYPIDEAIGSLYRERDASRPLLPICVSQVRSLVRAAGDLSVCTRDPFSPGIVFDLWLLVGESEGGLEIHLKYDRDLFDACTIERLADALEALLAGVVERPAVRLSQLALLPPAARQHLQLECDRSAAAPARHRLAHQQLARRAGARHAAVAVVCGNEQVRYGELNARSNRLAHWLRSHRIGREDRVALFGERGIGLLTAMLGALKAGAAFVPLDPGQPDARLRTILRSAGVSAIASQGDLALRALELAAVAAPRPCVFCFDEAPAGCGLPDSRTLAAEPPSDPEGAGGPHELACVFYTSGSTGAPKGVMVEQQGMLNHLCAKIELLELGEASVVAQNAPHCFDIWVWQSLAPLLAGGRVVIYDAATASDPQALLPALARDGVTVLETVPSFLEAMLSVVPIASAAAPVCLPRLSHLISNAETLPAALCRRWFERFPHVTLVNTYGATECSDDTTHHLMRTPPRSSQVPVGRPIPGLATYVVDAHLHLLPAGLPGQIAMAGVGLGRGYLGEPDRTARTFVPDPLSGVPGGRVYLTGDLGRWTREAGLEFLGRKDHQLKIRGFRVELGEIEAALASHPAVAEAAVAARETAAAKRLVAYLVPRQGQRCEPAALRRHLTERLPEYMLPGAFVELAEMPRTITGKVDRRALPEPPEAGSGGGTGFVAPRTPAEELLAAIWSSVLRVGRIGAHDNFFALGGDSLLSIQVVSRARQAGLDITPRQLFEHQTVAELAAAARAASAGSGEDLPVAGDVGLTPIQQWFFEQDNPRPDHFNMGVVFEVVEPMVPALLAAAFPRLVAHHDALRLRFVHGTSGWRQSFASGEPRRCFSHLDLSRLPAAQRASAIATQAARLQASLSLATGPLLRAAYLDCGPGEVSRLLLVVHHLVVDVVAFRVLLEDLLLVYGQLLRGGPVSLPGKTTSYQRWSELLAKHASSAALAREQRYWLQRLPARISHLPMDRRTGRSNMGTLRHHTLRFEPEETRTLLRAPVTTHRANLEAILLTALVEALARATGERTLLIELAGHGREEILAGVDLTRTVGWFTTVFPLLLDLRGATTPEQALDAVAEQLRQVPSRGIGYGILRYLAPDPAVSAWLRAVPQAEVAFEYLGQIDAILPASSPLRLSADPAGPLADPGMPVTKLLEVTAGVATGCLHVDWAYSEERYRKATIEALAQDFAAALRSLGESCRTSATGPATLACSTRTGSSISAAASKTPSGGSGPPPSAVSSPR